MAVPAPNKRKDLSIADLLNTVRSTFATVPDSRRAASGKFSLCDTLSSALAMFGFKNSSLMHFDTEMRGDEGTERHNLSTLLCVAQAPSDAQIRETLDPVDPSWLRPAFRALHSSLQRGNVLRNFSWNEDALAANGPHIQELLHHKMDFIIGDKPSSGAASFDQVHERLNRGGCTSSTPEDLNGKGFSCGYRFTNDIALNDSHPDIRVNFLEYWEFDEIGKQTIFAWVSNLPISADNAYELARAGLSRW